MRERTTGSSSSFGRDHLASSPAGGSGDGRLSRRALLGGLATLGAGTVTGCLGFGNERVDPVWSHDVADASAASPPAVVDDHLLVGAQDRALHAIDTADGTASFAVETGGPIETRPAVPSTGGPYHVHSTDGDVYTVAQSGERLWHQEGQQADGHLDRAASLLVSFDFDDDAVVGFDAETGTRRFRQPITGFGEYALTPTLFVVPTLADGERTRFVAMAPSDGSVRWETPARQRSVSVAVDGELLVATRGRSLVGWSLDGDVRWQSARPAGRAWPLVLGEHVYTHEIPQDGDERLVAIDRSDGSVAWRGTVGYDLDAIQPADDVVFVASTVDDPDGGSLGRIDCFEADGTRRWQTTTDVPQIEDVAVVGDLVVGIGERDLVALDPATGERRWGHEHESGSRLGVATTDTELYVSYRETGAVARLPTDG